MKRTVILSLFIDEVCTKLDFVPFGLGTVLGTVLGTSNRSKPAKCLSPRKGNK